MLIEGKCHCGNIAFSLDRENVDPSRVKRGAADFEGEDMRSRLARRKRGWIPEVRLAR